MHILKINSLFFLPAIFFIFSATTLAEEKNYIKAVTYFGSAWPINYWNSQHKNTESDFSEIKADGFNAVILVVPWGEFQPQVKPAAFNQIAFDRLGDVCHAAKAQGLQFYMRVSYLWDMYPGAQQPHLERTKALFSHDKLMPAWKQYLQRLNATTQGCADGAFISWEDFWHMIPLAASPKTLKESAFLSAQTGFDAWAKKHAEPHFRSKHAAIRKRLGAFPFPARNSPDFRLVFQWFDDILANRLLPAAAENISNISMEVRVDDDPIYDDKRIVEWYSHKKTYKIPSSPFVMTYWAPAMGAQNKGEVEPAKKVQDRFSFMQKKIKKETSNKIFIDQFLFSDNTPSAAKNATVDPKEMSAFIQNMAKPLVEHTSGYALWGARNYEASIVFNGAFSLDTLGWIFSNRTSITPADSDFLAKLPQGSTISQAIPVAQDHFRAASETVTLRFLAQGPGIVAVTYAGTTKTEQVSAGSQAIQMVFPRSHSDATLSFTSQSGTVQLTDIYLFSYTQQFGVRDPSGNPLAHLADIRTLNQSIDTLTAKPTRLLAGDQTLQRASGVFASENDNTKWFAWAGPEVHARIFTEAPHITVQGFMKTSVFKHSKGCNLEAYVNGKKILSKKYISDEPIDLKVPVTPPYVGTLVDLKLTSSCKMTPTKRLKGKDARTLSFILNEISTQPTK